MKENSPLLLKQAESAIASARRILQRAIMNDESEQDYEIAQLVESCLALERRTARLLVTPDVPAAITRNNVTSIKR